jgi:hypothetical protein
MGGPKPPPPAKITEDKAKPFQNCVKNDPAVDTKQTNKRKKLTKKKNFDVLQNNKSSKKDIDIKSKSTSPETEKTTSSTSSTEIQIKNLEKSLLEFQSRMSTQEILVETLTQKLNMSIPAQDSQSKT